MTSVPKFPVHRNNSLEDSMGSPSAQRSSMARRAPLNVLLTAIACCAAFANGAHAAAAPAVVLANPTVDAGSPVTVLSPLLASAVIPVTVTRTANTPIAGVSVTFQLTNLTFGSSALGGFLSATGASPSGVFVTNNGGGSYTLDAATLGSPCGSGALTGTLFNVTVGTVATSGAGGLVITSLKLRDCANATIPTTIGSAGSVAIDFTGPAISNCAPNQTAAAGAACQGSVPDFTAALLATDAHGPITVTQTPLAGTAVPLGVTNIMLTAKDALNNSSTCVATVTVTDQSAPLVTLTSPNGGESWTTGSSHTISWSGTDNCTLASFDIALSTDGGNSFAPVVSSQPIDASYNWTVPASLTTQARIRVTLRDAAGNAASDASDASFTIRPTNLAPVLNPIGNKVIDELVLSSFTATASDPDAGQTLQYSLDPGAPAGTAIDANSGVFTWTPTEVQGPGVYSVTIRVTDNGSPVLSTAETISITVNEVELAAVALTAAQVLTGNDGDGTIKIHLSWTPQGAGSSVALYRRGFGGYPAYDDASGVEPAAPGAYPPAAGWTLAGTVSGAAFDDEVAWPARDAWYYMAYVLGPGANVSPPSNRTAGTLNYLLGDVMNPNLSAANAGHGDNVVNLSDISLLGAHYGLTGGDVAAVGYLDVGPTTTGFLDGRPVTDQKIDFEDLMLFSINYTSPPSLVTAGGARPVNQPMATPLDLTDHLSIDAPALVHAGDTFTVLVRMHGAGGAQGVSTPLVWDNAVAHLTTTVAGAWLTAQNGVMFSPRAGTIDAALLGLRETGMTGSGVLAEITFTAVATGDPHVRIGTIIARDAFNHPLLLTPLAVGGGVLRGSSMLWAPSPNPFRTAAQFSLTLGAGGPMDLAVYAVDGRRMRTLSSGEHAAGEYRLSWDGRGDAGQTLSAGVYFARLETRGGRWVRPVALLK